MWWRILVSVTSWKILGLTDTAAFLREIFLYRLTRLQLDQKPSFTVQEICVFQRDFWSQDSSGLSLYAAALKPKWHHFPPLLSIHLFLYFYFCWDVRVGSLGLVVGNGWRAWALWSKGVEGCQSSRLRTRFSMVCLQLGARCGAGNACRTAPLPASCCDPPSLSLSMHTQGCRTSCLILFLDSEMHLGPHS